MLCIVVGAEACILWYRNFGHDVLTVLPAAVLGPTPDPYTFQNMIGALFIVGGIALLPMAQKLLSLRKLVWLGNISFSLYLTHFPVLFTVVASFFFALAGWLPYEMAATMAGLGGLAACLVVAIAFERWVDRPSIRLSHRAG